MSRGRGPARRLLLVPVILLVGIVLAVSALAGATPGTVDPELAVDVPAPRTLTAPEPGPRASAGGCVRGGEPGRVAQLRRELGARPQVTSTMVLACPAAFDGLRVRYAGELVGDLLPRTGGAWVLVNDDAYALEVGPLPAHGARRGTNSGLSVWLPARHLGAVTGLGRPNQRGDVVAIEGVVERTDDTDGGGLTLRAEQVEVLAPARSIDDPLDVPKLVAAVALTCGAGLLWLGRRRARWR